MVVTAFFLKLTILLTIQRDLRESFLIIKLMEKVEQC